MQSSDPKNNQGDSRRDFLKKSSLITAVALTPSVALKAAESQADERFAELFEKIPLNLTVNNKPYQTSIEPRVTLLDYLREELHLNWIFGQYQ